MKRTHTLNAKRWAALAAAVLLALSLILSGLFVSTHLHHDCAGEDCDVCHMIANCAQILKLAGLIVLMQLAGALWASYRSYRATEIRPRVLDTLVSLKVKLTD